MDERAEIDTHYKTIFNKWYDQASIRKNPRRILSQELDTGLYCFPPEMAPVSQHPLLAAGGDGVVQKVLIHHLFDYLTFTDHLEGEVVNHVARRIASHNTGLTLPRELELTAYQIYCDEAYHSLFSVDLRQQVQHLSGVCFRSAIVPQAFANLSLQKETLSPELRGLADLFFVIVSETLITATLSNIPHDPKVVTAVRQMVADHAIDEGRHHFYFAKVCEIVWPQLTPGERRMIGLLLPGFIYNFLSPDQAVVANCLKEFLPGEEIEVVIAESYLPGKVLSYVKSSALKTLELFRHCGMLDNPEVAEAFFQQGLLD